MNSRDNQQILLQEYKLKGSNCYVINHHCYFESKCNRNERPNKNLVITKIMSFCSISGILLFYRCDIFQN